MDRLNQAVNFAKQHHKDQFRKGSTIPYVHHPMEAMKSLQEHGITEVEILMAAVLHDVLEDTSVNADQLRRTFGRKVTELVQAVTDDKNLHWKDRKIKKLEDLRKGSHEARLVKLSDAWHNIKSTYEDLEQELQRIQLASEGDESDRNELSELAFWNQFNRTYEQQKWYYSELEQLFKEDEILRKMSLYHEYKTYVHKVFG